jgi:hypothetical protein
MQKNLNVEVDEVIKAAGLPDTPEVRRTAEDLFMNQTDRYTEEQLYKIGEGLAD